MITPVENFSYKIIPKTLKVRDVAFHQGEKVTVVKTNRIYTELLRHKDNRTYEVYTGSLLLTLDPVR